MKDPPRLGTYAQWQLSRPATPRPTLIDLVHRATGGEVSRLERVLEGYSNEVYRAGVDGADVVVRVLRFDDDVSMARCRAEAGAIRAARAAGVPAPEVLLVAWVRAEGAAYPAMVQRAVPGAPLSAVLAGLTAAQRLAVLTEVGAMMARLGGVLDPGPGLPTVITRPSTALGPLVAAGFVAAEAAAVTDEVAAAARALPGEPRVLCHGDLSAKHLYVERDADDAYRLSGVIDFGDWTPGPWGYDLAVLRVRSPELELEPLLRGHGVSTPTARRRLDRLTLLVALDSLAFAVGEQDDPAVVNAAGLVRRLVSA